ncbi:hypothetical protein COO60DRAFT_1486127 [Scenedesmus sp. NREL 46B-D3]|nr:hypothetical protein COO60DRAFT_1486127 [Scenedesmus sp. NREL 46B-D3]
MTRALLIFALVAASGVVAMSQGIKVVVEFDNTLSRVKSNIDVVNKYMAEKLCRIPVAGVSVIDSKDQSTTFNHKSTVTFVCADKDTKKLISNCKGMWNRHQLKDEIEDHTTPDIEVKQVISCSA